MLIDKTTTKSLLKLLALSDRVILVKPKGQSFDIAVIRAYATTSDADDDETEFFMRSSIPQKPNVNRKM